MLIKDILKQNKIIAIVRLNNAQEAIDISKAIIDGGIKIIEITITNPEATLAIKEISKIENILVAAGSIITVKQANEALDAGAKLLISPITEMGLIKLSKNTGIPLAAGAATPNEIYNAWKQGVDIIKVFPVKNLGGPDYIKNILSPLPFLELMPTGGINLDNFIDYLKAGAVTVGIGNQLYPEKDFNLIRKNAEKIVQKLQENI